MATNRTTKAQDRSAPYVRLAAKAEAGQWTAADGVDWRCPMRLPAWLTREQVRVVISQLYHGEMATSRMCRALIGELEPGPVRRCMAFQIADELRHAAVYERYLEPLGGVASVDGNLARALDATAAGPAGSLGTMVAFHVVVEGEVLRVQDSLARLLPCPLLGQINRRVARDEARHVAFGRHYLTEALADLPVDARRKLYDWVLDLWCRTTDRSLSERGGSWIVRRRLGVWLRDGWCHHEAALRQIGLTSGFSPEGVCS